MEIKLAEFLLGILKNDYLTVLVISMFPLIELKGAIPIGQAANIPLIQTAALAYIGSTIVCIPLYFLLIPIFNLLKRIPVFRKLVDKIENVFKRKAAKIADKATKDKLDVKLDEDAKRKKTESLFFWALFAFVALPLPMTGVWTGTAIAVFLGIKFDKAFVALVGGNLVAGTLVTLFTFIFRDYVNYVILALAVITAIMLIVFIIKIIRAPESESADNGEDRE